MKRKKTTTDYDAYTAVLSKYYDMLRETIGLLNNVVGSTKTGSGVVIDKHIADKIREWLRSK